jgi:hypothetical protein
MGGGGVYSGGLIVGGLRYSIEPEIDKVTELKVHFENCVILKNIEKCFTSPYWGRLYN